MPRTRFHFVLYRDDRGEWRWRLVSRNGNIVANCGEGYRHRIDAMRIVAAIRGGATADAQVVEEQAVPVVRGMAAKLASLGPATKRTTSRPA